MAALGPYLRHLREERGLSIEEMARVTRVAPRYLEALEREDFTALPASVFTKGYIRAYCQALSVPVDEALARYAERADVAVVTPAPSATPAAARASERGRRSRSTLLMSFVLLVGFGLALFVVALFLQSGRPEVGARRGEPRSRSAGASAPEVPATPPSVTPPPATPPPATSAPVAAPPPAAIRVPSASPPSAAGPPEARFPRPTETRAAAEPSRTAGVVADPPPLQLRGVASPYRLVARTSESTWLRVRTEDGRATEETIPAGQVREWISNRPFVVTIGNAAGVALELNGQRLPALGGRGVVINRLILPPSEP
jgi:cytoskeleton protein RodZ